MAPADTESSADATATGTSDSATSDSETSDSGETDGGTGIVPPDGLPTDCAVLPPIPADAIVVGPEDNATLHSIVADAPAGSTIALATGVYERADLPRIIITAPGVTLRAASGEPLDAVLDGGGQNTSILTVAADDVLVAELTLRNSADALIDVGTTDATIQRPAFYRLGLRDAGSAKIDAGSGNAKDTDDGVIACSVFEHTDAYREAIDDCANVSAIRISRGAGWVVRDNGIYGHWCSTPTYAVLVADAGSRDTLVVRNTLQNNFRGILFGGGNSGEGRPEPSGDPCGEPDGPTWGHVRGVIANNLIWVDDPRMAGAIPGFGTDLDSMIGFWHACGSAAIHNTSYVSLTTFNGIEWRFSDTSVTIANNLVSTTLLQREDAVALGLDSNAAGTTADTYQDAPGGDFRLAPGSAARDAGIVVPGFPLPTDYNRESRVGRPDLGAFEAQP